MYYIGFDLGSSSITMYHRADNSLLIPESKAEVGRAYYAYGQHDAFCFSPFVIEDASKDFLFKKGYAVLNEVQHLIKKYQGTGKTQAVLKEGNEKTTQLTIGDYKLKVDYEKPEEPCFGTIIQTGEEEFTVIGMNLKIFFESTKKEEIGHVGQIWEGRYEKEQWIPT